MAEVNRFEREKSGVPEIRLSDSERRENPFLSPGPKPFINGECLKQRDREVGIRVVRRLGDKTDPGALRDADDPADGFRRPSIRRIRVDLPLPLSPVMDVQEPSVRVSVTDWKRNGACPE